MMTKKQIEDTIYLLDLETMCCWETIKNAISGLYELLEYKGLEEELGCSLEVLGKALIQNCFYDIEYSRYRETDIGFIPKEQIFVISIDEWENGNTLLLSDYKKTWWLNEDKSE